MEEKDNIANVPYIVYESAQTRMERTIKRLIVALIVAIVLMFISNLAWLYAWMQYDYVSDETETTTSTVDIDAKDGTANYIGNDGDIINGTDKSQNHKNPNPDENEEADE